ncbi:PIN-like domain-containing protein [Microbacterium sp. NPDC058269]|uniref:PIN-like domain-containing protein n=1 Tax=Microbacterium sp. NPDC058269 TaxID=3346414 RepID=UPI0036DF06E6
MDRISIDEGENLVFDEIRPEFRIYTDGDLEAAFQSGIPVYFDTNVFRVLWRMHTLPKQRVVDILSPLEHRTFLPFQVRYELAAQINGPSVLNGIPTVNLDKARGLMRSAFGELNQQSSEANPMNMPAGEVNERITSLTAEIEQRLAETEEWFTARQRDLLDLLGESPNVEDIKQGRCENVLARTVSEIFAAGHLLPEVEEATRESRIQEYQARISRDDPVGPGLTDRGKPVTEDAAGDYLMWREVVQHCVDNTYDQGFMLITEETKADFWEEKQNTSSLRRVNPDIQRECIEQTGGPMYLMGLSSFLALAAPQNPDLQELRALVDVAAPKAGEWSPGAVSRLLAALRAEGNERQALVIEGAAERDGYISRPEIGEVLGWGAENRYLTRFRMPADRIAAELVAEGILEAESNPPLTAVYNGPGEAVGYQVPIEFVGIIAEMARDGH